MTAEELYQLKKKQKKEERRNKQDEKGALTMTSLMDIVSIIVCYLLKTYASDPVVIMPVAEQKIPMSRMDAPIQEGSDVYISSREIVFGEKKLVQLQEGEIDPNEVKGHLIGPLYDALAEEVDKAKQMAESRQTEWAGRLIIVGDQDLKFSTLVDVMYTAGRAEFVEYAFCVIQQGR
jgi:biopolymer transport protein ExbD